MFWHNKSVVSMTFVCFGIAKLECQILNIIGYFFSISYMPMHDLIKKKNMQRKIKKEKDQNALNMIASVYFVFNFSIFFIWKTKQNKTDLVYVSTCVPWMAIETKFSKFCIFCNLDEHLYAQLSKWALWLLFVMNKIKLSLVLNTHITLFDGNN